MNCDKNEEDADFVQEYHCPICNQDLSTTSLYFRTLHLNNCLENPSSQKLNAKLTASFNDNFIYEKIYTPSSKKFTSKPKNCSKKKKKKIRNADDEQTEIAIALSKSLVTFETDKLPKPIRSRVDNNNPAAILMADKSLNKNMILQKAGEIILESAIPTTVLTPTLKKSSIQEKYQTDQAAEEASLNIWNLSKGPNIPYCSQYDKCYQKIENDSNQSSCLSDRNTHSYSDRSISPDSIKKADQCEFSEIGELKNESQNPETDSLLSLKDPENYFYTDARKSLMQMVGNKKFSDLKIICKNSEIIYAHKLIINIRAPSILKLLDPFQDDELLLQNYSSNVVLELLKFIYFGFSDFDPKEIASLFELSNLFNINKLKLYLSKLLPPNLSDIKDDYKSHNNLSKSILQSPTIFKNMNHSPVISKTHEDKYLSINDNEGINCITISSIASDGINGQLNISHNTPYSKADNVSQVDIKNQVPSSPKYEPYLSHIEANSFNNFQNDELENYYNQSINYAETKEETKADYLTSQNKSSTPIADISAKSISMLNTSIPHFSLMETPKLKAELESYGVRPLPKSKMVLLLKEISKTSKKKKNKEEKAIKSQKARTDPESQNPNSQKSSKQATMEDLLTLFKKDSQLLGDCLIYKKFNLKILQEYIRKKGMKCTKSRLKLFLDSQCINYSFTLKEKKEYKEKADE